MIVTSVMSSVFVASILEVVCLGERPLISIACVQRILSGGLGDE